MLVEQRQEQPPSRVQHTRQRIIEAALQVFSQHGYSRATTRTIAAAADVNEVTIFRHFGNKQNLLAAVIDHYSSLSDAMAALEVPLTGDYRQDLMKMAQEVLDTMNRGREMVQLTISEAHRQARVQENAVKIYRQGGQVLERYLRRQMEQGLVRSLDVQMAAQVFFGMLFAYLIGREILGKMGADLVAPQLLIAQCVDIFVHGTIKQTQDEEKDD